MHVHFLFIIFFSTITTKMNKNHRLQFFFLMFSRVNSMGLHLGALKYLFLFFYSLTVLQKMSMIKKIFMSKKALFHLQLLQKKILRFHVWISWVYNRGPWSTWSYIFYSLTVFQKMSMIIKISWIKSLCSICNFYKLFILCFHVWISWVYIGGPQSTGS